MYPVPGVVTATAVTAPPAIVTVHTPDVPSPLIGTPVYTALVYPAPAVVMSILRISPSIALDDTVEAEALVTAVSYTHLPLPTKA